MTLNAPPSGNPADKYSLRGVLRLVLTKFLQRTDDMLPAKCIAYNKTTNMATIQPMIMVVTTDKQNVSRAQVASVPVYQFSCGGFIIRSPCKAGDFGWIKANDRDIALFMQTGAESPPNTQRKHSFKDAMFYPQALWDLITIADEDADNMVIQSYDGTVKISLSDTKISMVAPTEIDITAPTVNINASTAFNINSPITAMSGVFATANEAGDPVGGTVNGSINVIDGDVTADTISLKNHRHGGVTTGGGDTGGAIV